MSDGNPKGSGQRPRDFTGNLPYIYSYNIGSTVKI